MKISGQQKPCQSSNAILWLTSSESSHGIMLYVLQCRLVIRLLPFCFVSKEIETCCITLHYTSLTINGPSVPPWWYHIFVFLRVRLHLCMSLCIGTSAKWLQCNAMQGKNKSKTGRILDWQRVRMCTRLCFCVDTRVCPVYRTPDWAYTRGETDQIQTGETKDVCWANRLTHPTKVLLTESIPT